MTITGTEQGDKKYKELQKDRWKYYPGGTWHCKEHDTYFDNVEDPCWQCYNECVEE